MAFKKEIFWSLAFLFIATLLIVLFITNENRLTNALKQDNTQEISNLLEKGGDPHNINKFFVLPSFETSMLLLSNKKKPLDPDKFIELVLQIPCKSEKLIAQRDSLVKFALLNGADVNILLEKVTTKTFITNKTYIALHLPKQENLIKIALDNGGEFSTTNIEYKDIYSSLLPSLASAKLILTKLDPSKFLRWVLATADEKNIFTNDLVELALSKGADPQKIVSFFALPSVALSNLLFKKGLDPDKFLDLVLRTSCDKYDHKEKRYETNENLNEQKTQLIKLALEKGANPKKIENFATLPSIEASKLLLKKGLDPSKFLTLVIKIPCKNYNHNLADRKHSLVRLAIEAGADPNNKKIYKYLNNPKTAELLFNNNHKKIDPKLFCQYMKVRNKPYYIANGLEHLLADPAAIFTMKYQNLYAKKGAIPKIPHTIHHIWLTNKKEKREILFSDIKNVLKTKELFSQGRQKWEHIVWTNNKNLIPNSVKTLESHGIKVREISKIKNHLKLYKNLCELIEQGKWGMASDTLRCDLLNHFGGIYADLNYIFIRDVEAEIYKYDFFTQAYAEFSVTNYFFGTKKHHPIMEEFVNLLDRNLNRPPEYISSINIKRSVIITNMSTADPIHLAYYKACNKNGNIDVVYPVVEPIDFIPNNNITKIFVKFFTRAEKTSRFRQLMTNDYYCNQEVLTIIKKYVNCEKINSFEEQLVAFHTYLFNNNIYVTDEYLIGADSKIGDTWINKERDG